MTRTLRTILRPAKRWVGWVSLVCLSAAFTTSAVLGFPNPYLMVDWDRHNNRMWVVVEPLSARRGRTILLYLTEPAYQRMSRIAMSNDIDLEIIATPDDSPDTVKAYADRWTKEHPETNSGAAIGTSNDSGKTPPPRGVKSYREPHVDGWVKFYERFLSPLLKPRGPKAPKVK